MAQTGYTPIKLYYSATPTTVPLAANLAAGELAINTADGKLYYKDSSNVVQIVAQKGGNGVSTFSGGSTGLTPNTATTGAVTLAGTLALGSGGTGQTTAQLAINSLAGAVTSGSYLRGNGTNVVMAAILAGDVPTLNQNTAGTAAGLSATLGTGSGGTGATSLAGASIVTYAGTETLTNKRITLRVNSQTTTTSPWTWNSDSYDQQQFTALANALTINADAGTPTDGQQTIFRFTDNGTARALTWATVTSKSFRSVGTPLPTTTIAGKTLYVGCIYNSTAARWDVIAAAQEA